MRILEAAVEGTGARFAWEPFLVGANAYEKYGEYIPQEVYDSIERNHLALKGPVTTPIAGGFASINVHLRKKFELFANFRPIKNLPGMDTRYPGVDLIIVRENTEGEYVGLEHEVVPGVVESLKIVTEKASTRIAKFAFEYARKFKRHKIHAIHKANIMKMSDGLFLRCAREVAKGYPEITYGEHIVDNTCMQLVMNPYQYDMLLTENLYGDIVSDLCAAFVGGLGLVPGANLGTELRDLRSGARFGARHCGQRHRQPHGAAPVGHPDAALYRRGRHRRSGAGGAGEGLHREEDADPRRGGNQRHQGIYRRRSGCPLAAGSPEPVSERDIDRRRCSLLAA